MTLPTCQSRLNTIHDEVEVWSFYTPLKQRKTRYGSRSLVNFISDSWANVFFKCLLTFLKVITLDLSKFTIRPNALQKLVRTSISEHMCVLLALIKRRTSSANKRCEMPGPFLETWIGCHTLSDTFLLIKQDSFFIFRTNKYGKSGSPCRSPWFGEKEGNFEPF
jgi:hypothetical protein